MEQLLFSLTGIKTGKPGTIALSYTALVILWLLPVRGGCVTSNYTAVGVTTLIWDMWSMFFEIFSWTHFMKGKLASPNRRPMVPPWPFCVIRGSPAPG